MPFREHPVFEQPEDEDHVVWRYMEGTQFISLLQNRGLYFNRADEFEDQFEGIFPRERLIEELIKRRTSQEITRLMVEEGVLPEEIIENHKTPEDELFDVIDVFRENYYINCWHMNNSESMAMWKAYITGGDGVLIKSTYAKLKHALDIFNDYVYRMGKVGYLPWLDEGVEEELDERERTNWLYPYVYKQEEYEYEQEIRVAIGYESRHKINENATGFFVPTDLNELIDSVIVSPNSPPWGGVEFWKDICRKYKLRTNVEKSSLDVTPEDILGEVDETAIEEEVQRRVESQIEERDFLS